MTKEEFEKQLKLAKEIVESWPEWKQNILEYSMSPTVKTPREPIFQDESWEYGYGSKGSNNNDFVKQAVTNSIELEKMHDKEKYYIARIMDQGEALMSMLFAFNMLTRDGGWDTLNSECQSQLTRYADEAREVWLGKKCSYQTKEPTLV